MGNCGCNNPKFSAGWCYGMYSGHGCMSNSFTNLWVDKKELTEIKLKFPELYFSEQTMTILDDHYNQIDEILTHYLITGNNREDIPYKLFEDLRVKKITQKNLNEFYEILLQNGVKDLCNKFDNNIHEKYIQLRDEYYKTINK